MERNNLAHRTEAPTHPGERLTTWEMKIARQLAADPWTKVDADTYTMVTLLARLNFLGYLYDHLPEQPAFGYEQEKPPGGGGH